MTNPSFRTAMSVAAKVTFRDGSSVPCTIENLSAKGAKIDVGMALHISDEFRLSSDQVRLDVKARVAWRSGSEVGVTFLDG